MKKLLFTLAALFACGAAFANSVDVTLSTNEVEMNPNERVDVKMTLNSLDGILAGVQYVYVMTDANDNVIPRSGNVYLNASSGKWMTPLGMSADMPENNHGQSFPAEGMYKYLGVNVSYNVFWTLEDFVWQDPDDPDADPEMIFEGSAVQLPQDVFQFTIRTRSAWDQAEAFLKLRSEDSKYSFPDGSSQIPVSADYSIHIINKAMQTQEITGTVTLGDNDGYQVPVTVTDAPEGYVLTVTVNGETVDVVDGYITLGVEPAYGDFVVVATVTCQGYEGQLDATRTYTIAQPTAPAPVITFTPNEDGSVTVNADPCTSVAIHVNGYEENYYEVPVTIEQGYAKKVITVEAQNAPNGYVASATVTDTYELAAKDKNPVAAPTVTYDVNDQNVVVTATAAEGAEGDLVLIIDGEEVANPATLERKAEAYDVVVVAYTEEGATTMQSALYNQTYTVPALEPTPVSAEPTVTVTEDGQCVIITVTGNGTVDLVVPGYETIYEDGEAYVIIPKKEEEGNWDVNYTATNTENGKEPTSVNGTVTVKPADKAASRAPEFRMEEYEDYVLIYAYVDAKLESNVVMYDELGVEPIDNPVRVNRPAYGEDAIYYTAVAGNTDEGWYKETRNSQIFKIDPKGPNVYVTPTPTVTTETTDDAVIITANGEGTVTLYVQTYDPETGAVTTTAYTNPASTSIARGNEDTFVYAWATAEAALPAGYDEVEATSSQSQMIDIPKKEGTEPEKTEAPGSTKTNSFHHAGDIWYNTYDITLIETEPSTIYYRLGKLVDGEYVYGPWQVWDGKTIIVREEGSWRIEAYAVANGKLPSDPISDEFTVSIATSIDEMFAGKDVASVRYFNVAGQEMNEINGMTIVVTTFTDGTQATVKVMK